MIGIRNIDTLVWTNLIEFRVYIPRSVIDDACEEMKKEGMIEDFINTDTKANRIFIVKNLWKVNNENILEKFGELSFNIYVLESFAFICSDKVDHAEENGEIYSIYTTINKDMSDDKFNLDYDAKTEKILESIHIIKLVEVNNRRITFIDKQGNTQIMPLRIKFGTKF